ncbi:cupin domain-containing protein [Aquisediminimonas profunda]|uniref:cupin domain-containing protein n=1 Tax=Aquisediminimonas profunda TaxID=1550733 RepID=UPI001FE5376A|nr:cupin domain-containing protein [Aquisediminimonas profunda]
MNKSFRRIVTAHDHEGVSIVRSNDVLTPTPIAMGVADFQLVWTTPQVPVDNNDDHDGASVDAGLTLKGGSVIRIVDMLPGRASPMHRSFSIDYGIVLSGSLELELDGGEIVALNAGDIVVQRGTNHLWRNTSPDTVCRIAFVLIEATPVVVDGKVLEELHP